MALPPDKTPPPDVAGDYAFTPADDKLLSVYLRCKIAGKPLPASSGEFFHDTDIYAADPATLTAGYRPAPAKKGEGGSWFFFTHVKPKSSGDRRKSRMVGGGVGTWHSERAPREVVDGEGNRVGHGQLFTYMRKDGKNKERTGWYMVEFVEDQEGDREGRGGGDPVLVLCKIYRAHSSSRRAEGSASCSSSTGSKRKGKAADERVDLASAPVRAKRRLFESPAPTPAAASQDKINAASNYASGSAGKRKSSVERADQEQAPAPVRWQLFDSPAPAPPAASLDQITTSTFVHSFWSEPQESHDWGFSMVGGGTTNLMDNGHNSGFPLCAPGAGTSASWIGGGTMASCSGDLAWFLGGVPSFDECGTAGFAGAPSVCGMPSAPVLPAAGPSWWCGGPHIWSC